MAGSAEQAREQESEHHAGSHSDVIASGTLLKKKRKALQGYAKRQCVTRVAVDLRVYSWSFLI